MLIWGLFHNYKSIDNLVITSVLLYKQNISLGIFAVSYFSDLCHSFVCKGFDLFLKNYCLFMLL
jgi:hypothetical protein